MASVEARPNGTYRVRWREGGKAQRLTCENRPYADAAAAWIEKAKAAGEAILDTDERLKVKVWLLRQSELADALAEQGVTLNDICVAYDRSHRGVKGGWGESGNTAIKFWSNVELYIEPVWGKKTPIACIGTDEVNELVTMLVEETDLAVATMTAIMTTARAILRYARIKGHTSYNVSDDDEIRALPRREEDAGRRAMTAAQCVAIGALITNPQLWIMYRLLAETGMRSGELLPLRAGDITTIGEVKLKRRLIGSRVLPGTKADKGRIRPAMAVSTGLTADLLRLAQGQPAEAFLFPREATGTTGKQWSSSVGQPWLAQTWRDERWWPLMRLAYEAGITARPKEFDVHSMRHFCITESLTRMPAGWVQVRSGHSDLATTMRYHDQDRADDRRRQQAILDDMWSSAA